ncbi:MAG: 2-amino-4-hydroxy-6-hydroxymethyldihydropteridine diphosphokinase [Thermacetogenium sp.]|nr:2-amino-4-hydroxy-6-hydroxymethyldihydropteridine diphosphokinase [Thermacetogenium sp.]
MAERRVFLSLGSNLGNRSAYLEAACRELAAHPEVRLLSRSSLYETEPVGYRDQGWFLNQVVEVATTLEPRALLAFIQEVENRLGRKRLIRWGPRVIDLDILLFGDLVLKTPELIIPHPRMYERSFVLVPLQEIAPDLIHPDGRTTREHAEELQEKGEGGEIRLYRG